MLVNGEKWACDACVRGHRVSSCNHGDRHLQHINKKGRPVSQCTHCRTLRKSRSAHVRCDCGEKAHSKGACTHGSDNQTDDCCCSHGGRCACALKKEHLDPVPESDSDEPTSSTVKSIARPRAVTSSSDLGLTTFTNGHHKPPKHNNMAHKCGLPYVVPRQHSIHGSSPPGLANRSVDNLPHTSTIEALHSDSHIKDSMVSAQQEQRKVKSEHGSPIVCASANLDLLSGHLPPLDLANISGNYNFLQDNEGFSAFPDHDQPLFSAGLSAASIDWSQYNGLDFNNDDFTTSPYSQAASFTGFELSGIDLQPALTTTSTSGEISEVEDYPQFETNTMPARPSLLNHQYGSDMSDFGGEVDYRLSAHSSYMGMPQGQPLGNGDQMQSYLKTNTTTEGFDGLPAINFTERGQLPLLPTEDENAFWFGEFPANNMNGNMNDNMNTHTAIEAIDDGFWVQ